MLLKYITRPSFEIKRQTQWYIFLDLTLFPPPTYNVISTFKLSLQFPNNYSTLQHYRGLYMINAAGNLQWPDLHSVHCGTSQTCLKSHTHTHTYIDTNAMKRGDDPTGVCVLSPLLSADRLCSVAFCHAHWPSLSSPKPHAQPCSSGH